MSLDCINAGYTFVPLKIEEDNVYSGIFQVLKVIRENWSPEKITFRTITDGITNKIIACQYNDGCNSKDPDKKLIFRIYGNNTDLLINRKAEISNMKTLSALKLGPKMYGVFSNGLAYEFYPGENPSVDSIKDEKIWPLIARRLAQMHVVELGEQSPMGWLSQIPTGRIGFGGAQSQEVDWRQEAGPTKSYYIMYLYYSNMKTLSALKLGPKMYGVFSNGLAYEFYPGENPSVDSIKDEKIWPLIARRLAQMHVVELGEQNIKEPMLWSKLEQFLSLLPEPFRTEEKQKRFIKSFGSVTKLRIEYERMKSHLSKSESPVVFAHNDLLLGNIIYNEDEASVKFIDFEYANYNYQAFDLANHFNEFVGLSIEDIDYSRFPSKKFQWEWIRCYLTEFLNRVPSEIEIETVYKQVQYFVIASHFFWGIWSFVQYEISDIEFDYARYGEIRLNKYYELKDKVYKELSDKMT